MNIKEGMLQDFPFFMSSQIKFISKKYIFDTLRQSEIVVHNFETIL